MKIKLLPLLLLFSCTTGELEQVYKDVSNARAAEACEDISQGDGITITDCSVSAGGQFTNDIVFTSDAGALFGIQSFGTSSSSSVVFGSTQMEILAENQPLQFTLTNAPLIIEGLGNTSGTNRLWVSNGIVRHGALSSLNEQGVRAGSASGNGNSITVNIGGPAAINSNYKVSITPTSPSATTPYYVSTKTTTSFTVTYTATVTGISFDWIITP